MLWFFQWKTNDAIFNINYTKVKNRNNFMGIKTGERTGHYNTYMYLHRKAWWLGKCNNKATVRRRPWEDIRTYKDPDPLEKI